MATTATVHVQISIKSWVRRDDLPFRPTDNWTTALPYTTDTNTYQTATIAMGNDVYTNLQSLRGQGALSTILIGITIENVTAAYSGQGVVPLSKQHIDFAFSDDEVTSGSVVTNAINTQVADLINRAKY